MSDKYKIPCPGVYNSESLHSDEVAEAKTPRCTGYRSLANHMQHVPWGYWYRQSVHANTLCYNEDSDHHQEI